MRFAGIARPPSSRPSSIEYLDRRGAEFTLTQRLRTTRNSADVRYDLARLYLRNGDAARALSQFDTLARSSMDCPRTAHGKSDWISVGLSWAPIGPRTPAKELEAFVKKQKDSPRFAEAVYFLAEARLAQGERKDARKWFRKLLEVKSSGWLADRSRARLG